MTIAQSAVYSDVVFSFSGMKRKRRVLEHPSMDCKFVRKCQFYSSFCVACPFGGGDYCGAFKNLEYGRVKAIVEKEKGIIRYPKKLEIVN